MITFIITSSTLAYGVESTIDVAVDNPQKITEIQIYNEDEMEQVLSESNLSDGNYVSGTELVPYETANAESLAAAKVKVPTYGVFIYLFRSGKTTTVNVYAKYVSTLYSANTLKMSSLKIMTSTQKTTYKNFGPVYKTFPAGKSKYVYLGNAKIPKTVKKAYVRATGIKVYTLKKGWLSVSNATGIATIN